MLNKTAHAAEYSQQSWRQKMTSKSYISRWHDSHNTLGAQSVNLVAGDIGGTWSRLAWFSQAWQQPRRIAFEHVYRSDAFTDAIHLLRTFFVDAAQAGLPDRICLALPGPVDEQRAALTNLDWIVDAQQIATELGLAEVCFVNDFQAAAAGVESLGRADLRVLIPGVPRLGATRVITGAGTGLGVAWMQSDLRGNWQVFASEGGHADFAPVDARQCELLHWLAQRHGGHVSWERVLSGGGLSALHAFVCGRDPHTDEQDVEPARIHELAVQGVREAVQAIQLFADVYAAWVGNLAVLYQPRGGLYLAGGMSIHLQDWLVAQRFVALATAKGRMSALVTQTPVYLVTHGRVGLLGAMHLCSVRAAALGCRQARFSRQ